MTLSAPLNEWQAQVLAWIANGCPDGVMHGSSHKTTAIALQGRRLVSISKKGGVWRADITPAGQHYLTHGTYPDGHWKHRTPPSRRTPPSERTGRHRRATKPTSDSGAPARDTPSPAGAPSRPVPRQETADGDGAAAAPEPQPRPAEDTHTIAALIARVIAAGGVLEVDDINAVMRSRWSYADLTRESKSSPFLPPGKLLRARPTGGWSSRRGEVYLDDDFWAQTDAGSVPVPGRVSRFHPAVQAYRDDPDRHEVSRDSLARACRILQAIAVEAEARGYSCTAPSRQSYNSDFRQALKNGQLHVTIGDFTHRLRIRERSAPGGSPTYTVLRRASTMPPWKTVRKKVFIPTGELLITIDDGDGRDGRPAEYRDGKRQTLEDRLPSILRELETRAREDDQRRREKEQEAARRRANWERAMVQARHDHREAYRRDVLRAQVVRWREDAELALYVRELSAAVASITKEDERREAQSWLDWIQKYRENRNPLRRPAMPPDPQPSPEQLKPFLKGWSPYGPGSSY